MKDGVALVQEKDDQEIARSRCVFETEDFVTKSTYREAFCLPVGYEHTAFTCDLMR